MALPNNPTPSEVVKEIKSLDTNKQDTLVSGTNIKTINNESILGSGNITIGGGGTSTDVQVDSTSITSGGVADLKTKNGDYNASTNKLTTESDLPSKYLEDTLLFSGHGNYVNYLQFVRDKANTAGYKTESLTFNKDDFDSSVVVDGTNRYIEYTISQNIARASAKQDVIDASHKLSADLVDDTSTTNKFVTANDKSTWNGKQDAINDLTTIRSGASAGATAVQPSDLLNLIFPIGSIYIGDENSSSPASWIGGTWQQIEDKFLLASGSSYTAGDTGGSATHTHTLDNGYAKIAYIWQDSQNRLIQNAKTVTQWSSTRYTRTSGNGYTDGAKNTTEAVTLGGTTDSSSNIPPYKVVRVWQRTA